MDASQRRELNDGYHRSSGSFELLLAPLLFGLLGLWLDSLVGTRPLLTVVLALLALVGAFCKQYYGYRHAMAEADAARLQLRQAAQAARQREIDANNFDTGAEVNS